MATLTVWKFDSVHGAEGDLALLQRMQREELVTINDAAYVYWPEGRKKPKTQQLHSLAGAGALGGSFWGLLFGLIFFVPLLGMAMGAAMGAIMGSMSDVGIDDSFINQVREQVQPGTSALFVMTSNVVVDKVVDEFKQTGATLISTNLSNEQEGRLREAFAEAEWAAREHPRGKPAAPWSPARAGSSSTHSRGRASHISNERSAEGETLLDAIASRRIRAESGL